MSDLLDLLESYVKVAGGTVEVPEPGLVRFTPAPAERVWFGNRIRILALDVEHMDIHASAEMAVMGSGFSDDLLKAIRSRGARVDRGCIAPSRAPEGGERTAEVELRRGSVVDTNLNTTWLPVGRLHVAASVRTGHEVDDHLVSTRLFHLGTGATLPGNLADAAHLPGPGEYPVTAIPPVEESLPAMLDDIERGLTEKVESAQTEAQRRLKEELARLDRYYGRLIAEERQRRNGPRMDAIRAYEADRERRKAEEEARNRASAELRPVQVEVHHVLAQRRRLILEDEGIRGVLEGHRLLIGEAGWAMSCPSCGNTTPETWAVCTEGHAVCSVCSDGCTLCGATTCERHGGGRCVAGRHATCRDHGEQCTGCGELRCSEHAGICEDGSHMACTGCLVACDICGSQICGSHTRTTVARKDVPSRALCGDCVHTCRGQQAEMLGNDQVVTCATCGQDVCTEHRAPCSVDGATHCRSHLRKTDRSRLNVCPDHVAACRSEPGVVYAANQVEACGSCGHSTCQEHGAVCYADGLVHCQDHVVVLPDGSSACAAHHRICGVGEHPARSDFVEACPICRHGVCDEHRRECDECGRSVCSRDWSSKLCRTCNRLQVQDDPPDELLDAFIRLAGGKWGRTVKWEEARDATHRVARVTLSRWRRTVVFCWDHTTREIASATLKGLFRSQRLR